MWYKIRPFFFFNDTATTEIYTLSLHEALPISNILSRPGYIPLGASADKEEIHACTVLVATPVMEPRPTAATTTSKCIARAFGLEGPILPRIYPVSWVGILMIHTRAAREGQWVWPS